MTEEHIPPGGAPAAPVAGWYADPGDTARIRFWDGSTWTDQVAVRPLPATAPAAVRAHTGTAGSSVGPVFYLAVGLVLLATIVGVAGYLQRHNDAGHDRAGAVRVCRNFVTARLQDPATARFGYVQAMGPIGDTWTVSGVVETGSILGQINRTSFTCAVEPSGQQGYWNLVSLRFSGS
jgi:uncharacterized protein DUF2510